MNKEKCGSRQSFNVGGSEQSPTQVNNHLHCATNPPTHVLGCNLFSSDSIILLLSFQRRPILCRGKKYPNIFVYMWGVSVTLCASPIYWKRAPNSMHSFYASVRSNATGLKKLSQGNEKAIRDLLVAKRPWTCDISVHNPISVVVYTINGCLLSRKKPGDSSSWRNSPSGMHTNISYLTWHNTLTQV